MRLRNRLWNPEHETPQPKQKRKSPDDDLCKPCPNYKDDHCKGLCPPMQWINGRSETKEIIPDTPISSHGVEQIDYNEAIYEMIADKRATDTDRLETIRTIANYKLRAIAACTLAYIPQKEIGKFAHISQGRISNLYRTIKR